MKKNLQSNLVTSMAVIVLLTMAISIGGSLYQQFLSDMRYATLNEKEASKEVLAQTESKFSKYDISEYNEMRIILTDYLIPISDVIEDSIANINNAEKDRNKLNTALGDCLTMFKQCGSKIIEAQTNSNYSIKEFLDGWKGNFEVVIANLKNMNQNSTYNEIEIANTNMIISSIKDCYTRYCYDLIVLMSVIVDNYNLSELYNHLYDTVSNMDYNPLIDLATPYFSLPREYAEAKEQQILYSHI